MKERKITQQTQAVVLNALAKQALSRHKPSESFFKWCNERGKDPSSREDLDLWAVENKTGHAVGAVLESQATIELLMSGHSRETMALGILASARAARHQAMAKGDAKAIASMADLELRLLGMAKDAEAPRELRSDDEEIDPAEMSDADLVRALSVARGAGEDKMQP